MGLSYYIVEDRFAINAALELSRPLAFRINTEAQNYKVGAEAALNDEDQYDQLQELHILTQEMNINKKFPIGAVIGASMRADYILISLRYNYGLNPIFDESSFSKMELYRNSIELSGAFMF